MRLCSFALLAGCLAHALCGSAVAQSSNDAKWIWVDAGDPAVDAPAGKAWFRKEVRSDGPSTGLINIACDDHFVVWANGEKVGEGGGLKAFRFNLSGIVGRGVNVLAIEATNAGSKAGLYVDGEIRTQGGVKLPCNSGSDWHVTTAAPKGDAWLKPKFDETSWKPAKELGTHDASPWKEIVFKKGELDRFQLPEGFELKRIGEPALVGSLVAFTWGNRGRIIASPEGKPVINVIDENGDGVYDKVTEYSSKIKNCQGLCVIGDDLIAVGDGPEGTGMYRLPDANHDDQADDIQLLVKPKGGMGEHGPHDVVFGPDGWLYHNLGNHAWITNTPEATTPCRNFEEGYLFEPKYEDAGGHAVGIKAPGGTNWRLSPDGKKWWMETNGFRNHYDIAFNSKGDLFTFDSDMEWDVGLPWYRPVRINHCIPGAEFGWRSGAATWPEYFFDSLPGTIDIGRGSPTGVVFYEHTQFPERFRGALLNCDWSMGRIIAAMLKPEGVTYTGTSENLATGNPLNVSDIEVDRDGTVVFCTGGRRTEGGLYRITYTGSGSKAPAAPPAETLADALAMPQSQANWAREAVLGIRKKLGDQWEPQLIAKAKQGTQAEKVRALTLLSQLGPKPSTALLIEAAGDTDAGVKAFATWLLGSHNSPEVATVLIKLLQDASPVVQRRACEAFVRSGLEAPVDKVLPLLASEDRWLRFAARLTLERIPVEKWREEIYKSSNPDVTLLGLLALQRSGTETFSPKNALVELTELLAKLPVTSRQRVDALRMLELTLIHRTSETGEPGIESLCDQLLNSFLKTSQSSADKQMYAINTETSRILAFAQVAAATPAIVAAMEHTPDQILQMHYVLCLRYLNSGWTPDLRRRVLDWYEKTRDWEGGNSLQGYLRNIIVGHLEHFTPEERKMFLEQWEQRPFATRVLIEKSSPSSIRDFDHVLGNLLKGAELRPAAGGHALVSAAIDALAKSDAPDSQASLRKLFDENADMREQLARGLAKHPTPENIPYLQRSLQSDDKTTLQICLEALASSSYQPTKPAETRAVILAGLRIGAQGGATAVKLLKKWTGTPHKSGADVMAAIAEYQAWFHAKYPDEPAAELAKDDVSKTKYTFQQLADFLDKNPQGRQGNVERGRQVFAKANCIKCHRFLKEGEGVGPDLTSVRRRFQRKEIIESLVYPSQVISDQYAAVTVVTGNGLVHTGLPLPNPGSDKLLLLLPDATKIEIPAANIDEKVRAKISVMPEGLLKLLTLEEIADLFAFLETSRNNPEPAGIAAPAAPK